MLDLIKRWWHTIWIVVARLFIADQRGKRREDRRERRKERRDG